MYIAFRWLVSLALTMWLSMCFINIFMKENQGSGLYRNNFGQTFKNISKPNSKLAERENLFISYNKEQSMAAFHLMMFVAGALVVSVIHKKQAIVSFTKSTITKINIAVILKKSKAYFKNPAKQILLTIVKKLPIIREKIIAYGWLLINYIRLSAYKTTLTLNKPKEIGEERKRLSQLLSTAIQENKNIRMNYELETMAKSRLAQQLKNTNKQIKENRSNFVIFQHLYLATHQDNLFLKALIKKLTKEKDNLEKKLMSLINEVFKSKNNELKTYCSRYLVKTKDNLLNSDVSAEIEMFLRKAPGPSNSWRPEKSNADITTSSTCYPLHADTCFNEIIQDESLKPLVSDSPKLKGLPGECVWTVKDKDGIIEKLYEFDSEFDHGDTIRRIRQYSVYYDKDCLLDFRNSYQYCDTNVEISEFCRRQSNVDQPMQNRRIVSGSEAFKKFLNNNKSIVPSTSKHFNF